MPLEINPKFLSGDMATDQEVGEEIQKILLSPNLSGTPTAPTPPLDDVSNRIATTAFVKNSIYLNVDGGTPSALFGGILNSLDGGSP